MSSIDDIKRDILDQVAAGTLSPGDAAERLAALRADESGDRPADAPGSAPPGDDDTEWVSPPPGTTTVTRIRVVGALRAVHVVGDSTVREAMANGPHVAHRDGDTLTVEVDHDPLGDGDEDDFDDDFEDRPFSQAFRFRRATGIPMVVIKRGQFGQFGQFGKHEPLTVRMNPNLSLDAQVDAGTLRVSDVRGPMDVTVNAGSAKLDGVRAPININVSAGNVSARGVIDHSTSRVKCDAGSVKLHLERGSSVRVKAETNLGKVSMPGIDSTDGGAMGLLHAEREGVIGAGSGRLEVEVNVGNVRITTDDA